MPSIFNHQNNACWGVQKSYNLLGDQIVMLDDPDIHKFGSNSSADSGNSIQNFHGSSNGYYGFQMHIPSNSETENNDVEMAQGTSGSHSDNVNGRKRCHPVDCDEEIKRFKKNETLNCKAVDTVTGTKEEHSRKMTSSEIQSEHQFNKEIWEENCELVIRHNIKQKEDDLLFLESYFKLTHGCDLYNFGTSDL